MSSNDGGGAVAAVHAAVDALAAIELDALGEARLLALTEEVSALVWRVQAQQTRLVGAVHRRGAAGVVGAVSTQAWLRGRLRLGDAAGLLRAAEVLERLPRLAGVFAAGACGPQHVRAAAGVVDDLPEDAVAAVDPVLADLAASHPPPVVARAAARIRDHLDPDAADERALRRLQRRGLSVGRDLDGMVALQGLLDPDGGELFLAALEACTPPPRPGDERTATQRRADALIQLCRQATGHAPTTGGQRPRVTVICDIDDLHDEPAGAEPTAAEPTAAEPAAAEPAAAEPAAAEPTDAAPTNPEPADAEPADAEPTQAGPTQAGPTGLAAAVLRGPRLGDGTPIPPGTARRIACDADLLPAVLGTAGQPLDLGRTRRLVSPAQRDALALRDGGCRFPGCDRPPSWTDAHHVTAWADGGPTDMHNLVLMCRAHHVLVHEGGWRLRFDPTTNTVTATPRDRRRPTLTGAPHHRPVPRPRRRASRTGRPPDRPP